MSVEVSNIKLNNGLNFPLVGLGTFRTADDPTSLINAIKYAINIGYRHFDCAWLYQNEDVIGRAIKEAIAESNGKIKREDLFIVSKVWNTFHSKSEVRKAFNETIKNLDLDYLDLYLVHWPMGFAENKNSGAFPKDKNGKIMYSDVHYLETYQALEELYAEGKLKSIGLSNFNIQQIQDILKNCKIKPVTNQVECHIYLQNKELIDFCQSNDISITAYAPMGAPNRSNVNPDDPILLEDPTIMRLAQKYNKSAGQICLRWAVQNKIVAIPKSTTPARLKQNIEIFDFKLNDEEIEEIRKLDRNFRMYSVTK